METKKTALFLIVFLIFSVSFSHAQQDYQKWLENEGKKFQEFKDARDKAFVEFLKKEWQAMQLFQGIVPDTTPKPANMPITTAKELPKDIPAKPIKQIRAPKPPLTEKSASLEKFISKFIKKEASLDFTFYDCSLKVNYDNAMLNTELNDPINEKNISNFWAGLSKTNFEDLLNQTQKLKQKMQLNDWGYCLLLNKIGGRLYDNAANERKLFVWFMLLKSGYDAKTGYDKSRVYLLLPSTHIIYGLPYFVMGEKRYYVVTFNGVKIRADSVFTYEGSYPDAKQFIKLNIAKTPIMGNIKKEKDLQFQYGSQKFTLTLQLEKDVIDFYHNYPQTDYEVYFDASLSPEAQYSLVRALKPIVEGKSEAEAVNILLRFVQTAFGYETDETQFGREKPFFAEETLFYPFSDCEDRAVLFAYLVRNLLGLEVIGLDYPGHVATAVKFSSDIKGDYVKYNGEKYIICDGTYINANIGQSMERYKNVIPEIIPVIKNN